MKIKKLGHCCLVVETNGKRIMTDPGSFSALQNQEKNIDLIIFTHEHSDHFHLDSLKQVLENNINALIITNTSVGKLLDEAGIKYEVLEDKHSGTFLGVLFEAFGDKHAFMRSGVVPPQNTGYFIENKFFYPGDAFTNPGKSVEILALPVSAPWLTMEDVLNYAQEVNPKNVFPVHDGMLNDFGNNYVSTVVPQVLGPLGINFINIEIGKEEEF